MYKTGPLSEGLQLVGRVKVTLQPNTTGGPAVVFEVVPGNTDVLTTWVSAFVLDCEDQAERFCLVSKPYSPVDPDPDSCQIFIGRLDSIASICHGGDGSENVPLDELPRFQHSGSISMTPDRLCFS